MKSKHRAGTLLQGPELSRMQRKFRGKVKWIRVFPDDAYLVLFEDDTKLYRPSRTWLKLHSQWVELKRKTNKFLGKKVNILWHDSVQKVTITHQRGGIDPDNPGKVIIISQHVEEIPITIWKNADRFWNQVLYPIPPSKS
jgi:hypothetical protein